VPQGFLEVNGKWIYTVGDLIINDLNNKFIPYNPNKINFSNDGIMAKAIAWLKIYCNQGPAQSALLLSAITPFLRPITKMLGLPVTVANPYVVGKSGVGKTSYAELLTSPFGQRGINLGSKKSQIAAVHSQYIDKPMLIDDLNNTASSREYEKKLALLSELLQMTSCGGEILSDEGNIDFSKTSLIVTAETLIKSESSTNRVVVINFTEPFNADDLTYLQRNRNQYAHFLMKFIYFLCSQSSSLTEYIKTLMAAGEFNMDVEHEGKDAYIGWARISNSYTLMKLSQNLITAFLSTVANTNTCKEIYALLNNGIKTAIKDTLDSVKVTGPNSTSELIEIVLDIFQNDENDIIADKYSEYKDETTYLFFRYKNTYYFRTERLAEYIHDKFQKDYTSNAILAELETILAFNSEGKSHHLPPKLRKKKNKDKDKRFSSLDVNKLIDRIRVRSSSYFDYAGSPIKELRENNF
jgi:hypothetical protein